jgi:hypothetical protein
MRARRPKTPIARSPSAAHRLTINQFIVAIGTC